MDFLKFIELIKILWNGFNFQKTMLNHLWAYFIVQKQIIVYTIQIDFKYLKILLTNNNYIFI